MANVRFRSAFGNRDTLYAVEPGGALLRFRWTGSAFDNALWQHPVVGTSWQQYRHSFCGDGGVVFTVDTSGQLSAHRPDPSGNFPPGPSAIATGWTNRLHVVYGGGGFIYSVTLPDSLRVDQLDASLTRIVLSAEIDVGGWIDSDGLSIFRHVVGGRGGEIFAVTRGGELRVYTHDQAHPSAPLRSVRTIGHDHDAYTHLCGGDGVLWAFRRGSLDGWFVFRLSSRPASGPTTSLSPGVQAPDVGWQVAALEGFAWPMSTRDTHEMRFYVSGMPAQRCRAELVRLTGRGHRVAVPLSPPLPPQFFDVQFENGDYRGCDWTETSLRLPSPSQLGTMEPGFYAARCTHRSGAVYDIPFVLSTGVRRPPSGSRVRAAHRGRAAVDASAMRPLLLIANTNTWNAYNNWGGYSSYVGNHAHAFDSPPGRELPRSLGPTVEHHRGPAYDGSARVAQTDQEVGLGYKRPNHYLLTDFTDNPGEGPRGASHMLRAEILMVDWLHAQGHAFDLYTDIDFERRSENLQDYAAVILSCHPEYWTDAAIRRLASYLDGGGSVLYLGGNAMYRPTRLVGEEVMPTSFDPRLASATEYADYSGNRRPILAAHTVNYRKPRVEPIRVNHSRPIPADLNFFAHVAHDVELGTHGSDGFKASAWETDAWPGRPGHSIHAPAGVHILAQAADPQGAVVAAYNTGNGGFVLGVASLTFVGAMVRDPSLALAVTNAIEEAQRRRRRGP